MRKILSYALAKLNYKIVRDRTQEQLPKVFLDNYRSIADFTMIDIESAYATWRAVNYIIDREIEGAIVECGVWRGGTSMLMARRLSELSTANREQYLFDTFEGMSEPTGRDIDKYGIPAREQLQMLVKRNRANNVWAYASLEDVSANFKKAGLFRENIRFVEGKVEDTIPGIIPEKIALLRLDTDWYESTRHELIHLYPRLSRGGVLLIDDYGYWAGAREAVEEYFSTLTPRPFMNFLPDGGVVAIKI